MTLNILDSVLRGLRIPEAEIAALRDEELKQDISSVPGSCWCAAP